jgi:hypothetical protein
MANYNPFLGQQMAFPLFQPQLPMNPFGMFPQMEQPAYVSAQPFSQQASFHPKEKVPPVVLDVPKGLEEQPDQAPELGEQVEEALTDYRVEDVPEVEVHRDKRESQFLQTFEPGSNSQHYNCATTGSCNVQGNQQIYGGTVNYPPLVN